ncbi:MAG: T9SS type A sorting domain-containing protein [Bacteroidia bacterium]
MKEKFLVILIIALGINLSIAQNYPSDCITAVPVCTNDTILLLPNTGSGNIIDFTSINHSVSNPTINPASTNLGCLLSGELNSYWVLIHIGSNGTLEFDMGAGIQNGPLDWIMWKYDTATCSGIFNNTLAPVRCNWNSSSMGCGTGIGPVPSYASGFSCNTNYEPTLNVLSGESYILCISNYFNDTVQLPINFTGTAQILCSPLFALIGDTICEGQTAIISAIGGHNHDWSANSGITLMNNNTLAWASPTVTTQYIVSASIINAGLVYDTATVVVLPSNDPQCQSNCSVNIHQPSPVCEGLSLTITADTLQGYNYNWITPNSNVINNQSLLLSSVPMWNDSIIVLMIDSGLIQCYDTITLNVLPKPHISIIPPTDTICRGDTVNFTFTGANWYNISPSSYIINYQINGFSATPNFSLLYQIYGYIPNGCYDVKYLPVHVKPTIIPNISYTNNVLTTTATQVTYQWNLNGVPIPGANSPSFVPQQNGTYTLTVTNVHNCSGTSQPIIVTNVGENDWQNSDVKLVIYPNPANTLLNIQSYSNFKEIKLVDFLGKIIYQEKEINKNFLQINVETLKSGIYIIEVQGNGFLKTEKLIKQ